MKPGDSFVDSILETGKLTNKQAYDALINSGLQWGRHDANHIYVWTQGYKCAEHYEVEKLLSRAGMRMLTEEFDKYCGQTRAVYRHKKSEGA